MSNALIGSQAQDMGKVQASRPQQLRDNQNQGLWQQQLEQASLWQTNLAITTFKSAFALSPASSQQQATVDAGKVPPTLSAADSRGLAKPEVDAAARAVAITHTPVGALQKVGRQGQVMIYGEGYVQASSAAKLAVDKAQVSLSSQQFRSVLTQAVQWQKQHVFLSDFDGVKQLWVRDSAVTKGISAKLAASLLDSMAQLGVELNSVVVNGQQVFAKNHGIKE